MNTFSVKLPHPLEQRQRRSPGHEVGTPGKGGVDALGAAIVDRQNVELDCFLEEEILEFLELDGVLFGQVASQAEVVPGVVQFPDVVMEGRPRFRLPGRLWP